MSQEDGYREDEAEYDPFDDDLDLHDETPVPVGEILSGDEMTAVMAEVPMSEMDNLMAAMDRLPIVDAEEEAPVLQHGSLSGTISRSPSQPPRVTPIPVTMVNTAVAEEVKPKRKQEPQIEEELDGTKRATPSKVFEFAKEIFGEERVRMEGYELTVHFPVIEITNGTDKHTIKDLFVKTAVPAPYFYGTRTTFTFPEWQSQYAHSHLPASAARGSFEHFCLGRSNFAAMVSNTSANPSEENWYFLLLSLTKYLEWESLEGGPHRKIREISAGNSSRNIDYPTRLLEFITHLPVETLEYNNGLSLNVQSSKLRQFYEDYSPIKSVGDDRVAEIRTAITQMRRNYRFAVTEFNGVSIEGKITSETEQAKFVDEAVMRQFNEAIQRNLIKFNKSFNYEYLKSVNKPALGAVPVIQSSDLDNYKVTAGKNRLASSTGSRARVVGRIDHFRKREDNRFRQLDHHR